MFLQPHANRNRTSPNHALQRTAPAVTLAASGLRLSSAIPRAHLRLRRLSAALLAALAIEAFADEKADAVRTLIPWVLDEGDALKGVRFADVVAATSGKRVLPIDRTEAETRRVLSTIGTALDEVLAAMNAPESPTRDAKRVNEMSTHFEKALRARLTAQPGLRCDFPKTAAGRAQRSGYPDLRIADTASGRVFYLDPKLFAAGSRTSTLRTFYYEPKRETNKITEDAHHLIAGIAHERAADGSVRFVRWELIDLSEFRVRLKAEFQASNADLYRPEAVVGSSAP